VLQAGGIAAEIMTAAEEGTAWLLPFTPQTIVRQLELNTPVITLHDILHDVREAATTKTELRRMLTAALPGQRLSPPASSLGRVPNVEYPRRAVPALSPYKSASIGFGRRDSTAAAAFGFESAACKSADVLSTGDLRTWTAGIAQPRRGTSSRPVSASGNRSGIPKHDARTVLAAHSSRSIHFVTPCMTATQKYLRTAGRRRTSFDATSATEDTDAVSRVRGHSVGVFGAHPSTSSARTHTGLMSHPKPPLRSAR
jgi:hypothetical protein